MHPEKHKNVLKLSAPDRYDYLIRKVADFEEIFLIHDNGQFVTLGDKEGNIALPVWPEREFAEIMLTGDWRNYEVKFIGIHDFIGLLDQWEIARYKVACFPGIDLNSVMVDANDLKNNLLEELQQYE